MKRLGLSFAALAAAGFCAAATAADAPAPVAKWMAMETTHYVWRKGAGAYTFVIEDDRSGVGSGDETSPRLKVVTPDGHATIAAAELGWTTLGEDESLAPLVADNLVRSKYLYVTAKLANARGEPALIVFGSPGGDDPGAIRVIMLDAKGAPRIVLAEESFDLAEIGDLDGDGVPEVAGYRTFAQMFNDCVKTYDPASVFKLTPARDRLVYDEALTRKYMAAHGMEWAGPKVREDVGVSVCGKTVGRVVPKPSAD